MFTTIKFKHFRIRIPFQTKFYMKPQYIKYVRAIWHLNVLDGFSIYTTSLNSWQLLTKSLIYKHDPNHEYKNLQLKTMDDKFNE